jgi:uncharacterized protein with HEPN domain
MKATLDRGLSSALSDIVFWGDRIRAHLTSIPQERFLVDGVLVDAVCFCILCVGGAAARIRRNWPDFAARNTDLELAHSSAMRNRIVHGYFDIDHHVMWAAATVSIPVLVEAARKHVEA